jgi:hypothetical protein
MKGSQVVRYRKPGTQNLYCICRNGIHKSALWVAPLFIYSSFDKLVKKIKIIFETKCFIGEL